MDIIKYDFLIIIKTLEGNLGVELRNYYINLMKYSLFHISSIHSHNYMNFNFKFSQFYRFDFSEFFGLSSDM